MAALDGGSIHGLSLYKTHQDSIAFRFSATARTILLDPAKESRRKNMNTDSETLLIENTSPSPQTGIVVDLVRAAQAGDRDAFGLLFERYRLGIVSLAMRRVRNADEAEELAQDVFVQALQKINQLRVPEAFGGWLRRIVHRMAINRMTRRHAAASCDPSVLEATCFSRLESPDDGAVDREEAADVRAAVERLGKLDRQTLQAFYLRGQTLVQMSDAFDAPVGTIKRRLHVARKRLAKEMDVSQAV